MKIYYVVPPPGSHYHSSADAQAAFEAGQVWQCIGWTYYEDGQLQGGVRMLDVPEAMRYSECEVHGEGEDKISVPKAFAMVWTPGRVMALRYSVQHGQRKVSYRYGPGQGKSLLDEHKPTSQGVNPDRRIVAQQLQALDLELAREGGWMTSAGLRFRPVFENEQLDVDPFPMVTWRRRTREERMGPLYLDANPACRTLGDRELEKWYTSAQHRAHNPYALRAPTATVPGGYRTLSPADSDDVLDNLSNTVGKVQEFQMRAPLGRNAKGR